MNNTGIEVKDLKVNFDDRGYLFEVLHDYDLPVGKLEEYEVPKFGQVYVVGDPVRGTIRAFHKHKTLWDFFCIVNGSAKFVFVLSNDFHTFDVVNISAKCPKLIVVPPGIWHGWKSLEDNTIMVSTGSEVYNKNMPDEERISFKEFEPWIGDVWKDTIK